MNVIKKCLHGFIILGLIISGSLIGIKKVDAVSCKQAKALETYSRKVTVGCGDVGYSNVNVNITHNMTTGKSYVSSVSHSDTIFPMYVSAKITSVETSPKVKEYFTGSISIKVTVRYTNNGSSNSSSGYIQL